MFFENHGTVEKTGVRKMQAFGKDVEISFRQRSGLLTNVELINSEMTTIKTRDAGDQERLVLYVTRSADKNSIPSTTSISRKPFIQRIYVNPINVALMNIAKSIPVGTEITVDAFAWGRSIQLSGPNAGSRGTVPFAFDANKIEVKTGDVQVINNELHEVGQPSTVTTHSLQSNEMDEPYLDDNDSTEIHEITEDTVVF